MWILDNEYNPFLLAFLGCVACLGAFVGWIMSGRKEALYAAAGLFILFALLIVTERMLISDREAIQALLIKAARDLETNNRDAIYGFIHPDANEMLLQAQSELPKYRFEECRITKIYETKVEADSKPKTAVVEFTVMAKGSFSGPDTLGLGSQMIPRFVRLNLVQDKDGKWKVKDYFHDSPEQAIMQKSP